MGVILHHSIIVTAVGAESIKKVHEKAKKLFKKSVSNIVKSEWNGYQSFFIAPDGSKEGWEPSEEGNENRQKFINWAYKRKDTIDITEVSYGGDTKKSEIIH